MSEKKKLVIFGLGQMGEIAYFYFTNDSDYEVVGFCVDRDYLKDSEFYGLPVVPFEEVEKTFSPDEHEMYVAIAYARLNKIRQERYFQAKEKGFALASYISSKATIWNQAGPGAAVIGDNCFIMENQVIQPFTKIGNNVIMWSGNHIGHHSTIGDHCFLASHIVISGNVTIGNSCFIGVNATVRDQVVVGDENIIGAGTIIMKNIEPGGVYKMASTPRFDQKSSQVQI